MLQVTVSSGLGGNVKRLNNPDKNMEISRLKCMQDLYELLFASKIVYFQRALDSRTQKVIEDLSVALTS